MKSKRWTVHRKPLPLSSPDGRGKSRGLLCRLFPTVAYRAALWVLLLGMSFVVAILPVAADGFAVDAIDPEGQGNDAFDLLFWDEDALFGGDDQLIIDDSGTRSSIADDLAAKTDVYVGGNVSLVGRRTWVWLQGNGGAGAGVPSSGATAATTHWQASATGNVHVDARLTPDFRVFAKSQFQVASDNDARIRLTELFADYDAGRRVYFRVGKSPINWGIGYFFSPADIVNVGRIDPENPDTEREGPWSVRAHIPFGSNNVYTHLIWHDGSSSTPLALAPKVEWVVGRHEWAVGAYYRSDRAPRLMTTVSGTLGRYGIFGKTMVSFGSDKRFVRHDATGPRPSFVVVEEKDRLFVHGTVGVRYRWPLGAHNWGLSGAAQYYYNGEGYAAGFLQRHLLDIAALVATGQLSRSDLRDPGRHYGAVAATLENPLGSWFTPSLFWHGNLDDGSGMASLTASVGGWDGVAFSAGVSRSYGNPGSEFAPAGGMTTAFVQVQVSKRF